MPREDLPSEVDVVLSPREFIAVLQSIDGEYGGVQVRSRPAQPPAEGENDDALVRLYGLIRVKVAQQVRIVVRAEDPPQPMNEGTLSGLGSVRFDVSDLETARLRTFDGNDYFAISACFPAFKVRIADQWIS